MLGAVLLAAVLVVSSTGPYTSIEAALDAAAPGDTIVVRGGEHPAVVLDKRVTLRGEQGAVLDGGGVGDVVRIEAAGAVLEGFRIQSSGTNLQQEHAGVTVLAADVVVRDNVLRDVLFGIFVKRGERSLVERNDVMGYDFDTHNRGDGIRAWYSEGVRFVDNRVRNTRDVILWFSNDALIEGNEISGGRYGLHFMYDDGMVVRGNEVYDNSVGIFLMYSSNVSLYENLIRDSYGPSGYGLGLKEIANLSVHDNVLLRNRIGLSFDTVPHGVDAFATVRDNLVAFNHVALSFQPSTERVELVGNGFDRNGTQIEVRGGGDLAGNTWNDERGNYWSDYVGYDADGDGVGDLAYRPRSLFESLRDEDPVLSLFNYGPSAIAVDFAARAVPSLRPDPKVVDEAPLLTAAVPAWFVPPATRRVPLLGLGGVLLAAGAAVATIAVAGTPLARRLTSAARAGAAGAAGAGDSGPLLAVTAVTKRYGARTVLDDFSLELRRGEAVALWGGNGAGKTTAIRCLLGLARCKGEVVVDGYRLARDPRGARRRIGYVPQDAQLPDLPAGELLRFFGALRGVPASDALENASLVGIEDHLRKRPRELSGGLRQRLALALALLGRPPLLLLDEPTANLDPASRRAFLRLIGTMRDAGTTVLFTTHRADEVVAFADRVVTLAEGRTVADQPAAVFARELRDGSGELLVRVAAADLERARELLTVAGFAVVARAGWLTLLDVAPDRPLHVLWEVGIEVLESAIGGAEEGRLS